MNHFYVIFFKFFKKIKHLRYAMNTDCEVIANISRVGNSNSVSQYLFDVVSLFLCSEEKIGGETGGKHPGDDTRMGLQLSAHPIALWRSQIAGLHTACVHHDFLYDDTGIDHPEFEHVFSWGGNGVGGVGDVGVVGHVALPYRIAIAIEIYSQTGVYFLRRGIVK